MAPFYTGKFNLIEIDLPRKEQISLIRIWNYNRNRVYSNRGVKEISVHFDSELIFFGHVGQAPGCLRGAEDCCEYLFFGSENVLTTIENNDWLNGFLRGDTDLKDIELYGTGAFQRPNTADKTNPGEFSNAPMANPGSNNKPSRGELIRQQIEENQRQLKMIDHENELKRQNKYETERKNMSEKGIQIYKYAECRKLAVGILETWGDSYYAGLNGIAFFDERGIQIPLNISMVTFVSLKKIGESYPERSQ